MPMSPMAEFAAGGPAYRVTAHCPRHEQIRAGMKQYGRPSSSAAQSVAASSASLPRAQTANAASAYVTGPAATMSALCAVYRRQGTEYRKPHERPQTSAALPERPASTMSISSSCGAIDKRDLKRRERRCDEILEHLVSDGGAKWGFAQQTQARIADENRDLLRHNSRMREETQQLHSSLRSEGTEPTIRTNGAQSSFPDPPQWPNPIACRVAPLYQSRYDQTFGLRDQKHVRVMKKRAKTVVGHERYNTLSSWGADPVLNCNR